MKRNDDALSLAALCDNEGASYQRFYSLLADVLQSIAKADQVSEVAA